MNERNGLVLGDFVMRRPEYCIGQAQALEWIAAVHAASEANRESLSAEGQAQFRERMRKIVDRCACRPEQIGSRGHVVRDVGSTDLKAAVIYDVLRDPRGAGTGARSRRYAEVVSAYFDAEYRDVDSPPADLIHVTCTGYVSPSGAQEVVAKKGWGERTRVTHAYHMGCYASLPATRLAAGALARMNAASRDARVDIVHTELCSLHMDPGDHSLEQLVVQSLFGDGFIRYSMRSRDGGPGLLLLAECEVILPSSSACMTWVSTDTGMKMTLARDIPERVAVALPEFVERLYREAGLSCETDRERSVFAVHPGGPRILDHVRDVLHLDESQLQASRSVLFDFGNMSSATLPHVWMRLLSEAVPAGTPVVSLAFGPGLTVCGAVFEKQ